MMVVVGLTGSVGMGKSYVAARLIEMEIPVFEADAMVHSFFETRNSPTGKKIAKAFPEVVENGVVDRRKLGEIVFQDAEKKKQLEAILHPQIKKEKNRFITHAKLRSAPLVVLDIPLLYEVGWDKECDMVIVVRASAEVQKKRVLSRPGMTEERFRGILAAQLPSAEKEKRADFVINTGLTRKKVVDQIKKVLTKIIDSKLKGDLEE